MSPMERRLREITARLVTVRTACPEGTIARWDLETALRELTTTADAIAETTSNPPPDRRAA